LASIKLKGKIKRSRFLSTTPTRIGQWKGKQGKKDYFYSKGGRGGPNGQSRFRHFPKSSTPLGGMGHRTKRGRSVEG